MTFYWHGFETSENAGLVLDTFYGTEQKNRTQCRSADQMVLGAGLSPTSGLLVRETGYHTVLRSSHSATVVAEGGWFSTPQIPKPVSAAVTQQWLRVGQLPLHAALMLFQGCGLLILGDSNSGKSTLTKSALRAGAGIVSDDYIRVQHTAAALIGHRVRGFLRERNLGVDQRAWLGPEFKSQRIDAVLVLDAPDERPSVTQFASCSRLSLAMALIRQSAPLFLQDFEFEGAHMRHLIARITQLPALKLSTGTDVKHEPEVVLQRIICELGL